MVLLPKTQMSSDGSSTPQKQGHIVIKPEIRQVGDIKGQFFGQEEVVRNCEGEIRRFVI
jgi:hypothetical protein